MTWPNLLSPAPLLCEILESQGAAHLFSFLFVGQIICFSFAIHLRLICWASHLFVCRWIPSPSSCSTCSGHLFLEAQQPRAQRVTQELGPRDRPQEGLVLRGPAPRAHPLALMRRVTFCWCPDLVSPPGGSPPQTTPPHSPQLRVWAMAQVGVRGAVPVAEGDRQGLGGRGWGCSG